jgi:hypothetical protein
MPEHRRHQHLQAQKEWKRLKDARQRISYGALKTQGEQNIVVPTGCVSDVESLPEPKSKHPEEGRKAERAFHAPCSKVPHIRSPVFWERKSTSEKTLELCKLLPAGNKGGGSCDMANSRTLRT